MSVPNEHDAPASRLPLTSGGAPGIPRVVRPALVDWVKFDAELARDGSVDPVDKALYAALASFVDRDDRDSDPDPDGQDVPTRSVLAACIGRSIDTVDRSTKRLEEIGLLSVERRRDPDNPRRHLPSVYVLLDYERWDERAAARAEARRAARERALTEDGSPGGSRTGAARGSRTGGARGSRTGAARGSRTGAADKAFREERRSSEKREEDKPPPLPSVRTAHLGDAHASATTPQAASEDEFSDGTTSPPVTDGAVSAPQPIGGGRAPQVGEKSARAAGKVSASRMALSVVADLPSEFREGAPAWIVTQLAKRVDGLLGDGYVPGEILRAAREVEHGRDIDGAHIAAFRAVEAALVSNTPLDPATHCPRCGYERLGACCEDPPADAKDPSPEEVEAALRGFEAAGQGKKAPAFTA